MEVENNEASKSLVRGGLGASILPLCAVAQRTSSAQLRVLRVNGMPLVRNLQLVSVNAEILPNAIREMASTLAASLPPRQERNPTRSPHPPAGGADYIELTPCRDLEWRYAMLPYALGTRRDCF